MPGIKLKFRLRFEAHIFLVLHVFTTCNDQTLLVRVKEQIGCTLGSG